jgi:predicted XRE-type DNA-binding protein
MARKRKTLLDELEEEIAANPPMQQAYQQELARLALANEVLQAREQAKLSQAQLAHRIGIKQAGVARMERADYTSFNMKTLAKMAVATGHELEVQLRPKRAAKK